MQMRSSFSPGPEEPEVGDTKDFQEVVSPFADVSAAIPTHQNTAVRPRLWIGLGAIGVILIGFSFFLLFGYLNDPGRTLEAFPVSKYLESYRGLAGSRFKAEVRVEADLGWKEETGRLMLFSFANEARPLAVMVPTALSKSTYFVKGQVYMAELEVKEGGLIYANSCRKN